MTDFDRLMLAADWRLEHLTDAIDDARYGSNKRDLVAERNRLRRFVRFCELARVFA